jgi:hypothetical protein
MGLFGLFKASKTILVVDGVSLNDALGMKGNIPPRNQLQMLRRLARFAQREKLGMVVALTGSPLHKAPAGQKFEEIAIIYSKSPESHAKFIAKTARSKGDGAILVTGNTEAEKIVGNSVKTMRVSTFRKAFDFGAAEGAGDGPEHVGGGDHDRDRDRDRERSGNNRNRPPRRRQQKPAGEKRPERERPPKEMSDADAINELIDLVD